LLFLIAMFALLFFIARIQRAMTRGTIYSRRGRRGWYPSPGWGGGWSSGSGGGGGSFFGGGGGGFSGGGGGFRRGRRQRQLVSWIEQARRCMKLSRTNRT